MKGTRRLSGGAAAPPEKSRSRASRESERGSNGRDRAALRAHLLKIRPARPNLKTAAYARLSPDDIARTAGEIEALAPAHLHQRRYGPAVALLARVLRRIEAMDAAYGTNAKAWFARTTRSGRVETQPAERQYLVYVGQALRLLESLGLTPSSAKALGLDVDSPDALDPALALAAALERREQAAQEGDAP